MDWDRSSVLRDRKEDYDIVKPLLLKYIKDNTSSYDKIVVPDSYKPAVPAKVKTKAPKGAVCARIPHFERYWHRDSESDITYKKLSTTYIAVENELAKGNTIIYGTQDEIDILNKFCLVFSYLGGRQERAGDRIEIGKTRVTIHKIANRHVKHYSNMGALSIKEYITKHYNLFISFKHAGLFNSFYQSLSALFEELEVFPVKFQGIYTKTQKVSNTGQYDEIFNTTRRGDSVTKEGHQEEEVQKLLKYYKIPYAPDNYTVNGVSIKAFNDMMRSIYNEIHFLSYTVDISSATLREYKETSEKGLNILKNIIKDHYKVVYYKINKFK